MALLVKELSIEIIEALRPLVPRIRRHDRSLADSTRPRGEQRRAQHRRGRAFGSGEPEGAVLLGCGERE